MKSIRDMKAEWELFDRAWLSWRELGSRVRPFANAVENVAWLEHSREPLGLSVTRRDHV